MEYVDKEVEFDKYCPYCAHVNEFDGDDPCDECLANPVNQNSHKPINYKEK